MVLRQSKLPLTFLSRPLGDMFCKSEGLIQSGTHILSYCADSFAIELSPPIGLYRLRLRGLRFEFSPKPRISRFAVPPMICLSHRVTIERVQSMNLAGI